MKFLPTLCWHLPRNLLIGMVTLYQHTLSPDHGPLRHLYPYGYCPHEPTCSVYGKQALRERGAVIGMLLILRRLLSCHPWTPPSDLRMRRLLDR